MKTRLFTIVLYLLFLTPMVIAQDADTGKISFAVLGGVNFQNINGKDWDAYRLANDLIIGYHAGVSAQIIFMPQFCF